MRGDKAAQHQAATAIEGEEEDPLLRLQREAARWRDLLLRQLSLEWELLRHTIREAALHLAFVVLCALALFGLYLCAVWSLLWGLGQMVSSFTESASWFGHLLVGGAVCLVSFLGGGILCSYQRRVTLKRLHKRYETAETQSKPPA